MVVPRDAPSETSDQICALYFLELVVGRMLQQSGLAVLGREVVVGSVKEGGWNAKESLTYFQAATAAKVH
jgi:hypothetical protein